MNALVILGHPKEGSFNHAIAGTVCSELQNMNCIVAFHDLYAEGFDPLLPTEEIPRYSQLPVEIQAHCRDLRAADIIVIVHPNWWGQPPAILKGWVDRVLRPGIAYEFKEEDSGDGVPVGLLHARTAVVFNTSNTPCERELSVFGDPLESLWWNCIFQLCGISHFQRKMFSPIVTSSVEMRRTWLQEATAIVRRAVGQGVST